MCINPNPPYLFEHNIIVYRNAFSFMIKTPATHPTPEFKFSKGSAIPSTQKKQNTDNNTQQKKYREAVCQPQNWPTIVSFLPLNQQFQRHSSD